jgi:hypothetical protein
MKCKGEEQVVELVVHHGRHISLGLGDDRACGRGEFGGGKGVLVWPRGCTLWTVLCVGACMCSIKL